MHRSCTACSRNAIERLHRTSSHQTTSLCASLAAHMAARSMRLHRSSYQSCTYTKHTHHHMRLHAHTRLCPAGLHTLHTFDCRSNFNTRSQVCDCERTTGTSPAPSASQPPPTSPASQATRSTTPRPSSCRPWTQRCAHVDLHADMYADMATGRRSCAGCLGLMTV